MKNEKRPEGGLLQSQEWADVLREEDKNIIELTVGNDLFFGVEQHLPIVGTYVYFPRMKNITENFIEKISQLDFGWVRLDVDNQQDLTILKKSTEKIVHSPHNMQPKENLIIDITKTNEELLTQMKSKTRYNIRLAQKKGVCITVSKEKKFVDTFYALVEKTAQRKDVTFHEKNHYEKILDVLPHDMIELYSAEYNGEIIAANLVSFYGGVATYLHGATANQYRNVMAPFLLQWEIMQDAKNRDCKWYDLGGIFQNSEDPGKQGITRFKNGFAPGEQSYATKGSYDVVLSSSKYFLYRFLQKVY